jgi:hypothetical protein
MEEIKQLLAITQKLREKYIHLNKQFSLDGKLVGDIGEVLTAEKYGLKLYDENTPKHDAEEISTGRKVQIKASFKGYCYFPCGVERIPDYFLSINILETGELEEMYNGPGYFIMDHYILKNKLKPYKNSYFTLSRGQLESLNRQVDHSEKIAIAKSVEKINL